MLVGLLFSLLELKKDRANTNLRNRELIFLQL